MESYAKLLTRWLDRKGLTPKQGAALLGCSVSTAYDHATGRSLPPATRIPHLAEVLGVGEAKLRRLVDRERTEREHRDDGGNADTGATGANVVVDAGEVAP